MNESALLDFLENNYLSMNKQWLMGIIIQPMISWQDKKGNMESMDYLAVTKRGKKDYIETKWARKKWKETGTGLPRDKMRKKERALGLRGYMSWNKLGAKIKRRE